MTVSVHIPKLILQMLSFGTSPKQLTVYNIAMPCGRNHSNRGQADSYQEAAMRMADMQGGALPNEVQDDDSGASEADLLCSEVLSESHDEGSDVGSDGLYRRRYTHHAAQVNIMFVGHVTV